MDPRVTPAAQVHDRIAAGDAHRIAEMFDAAIAEYGEALKQEAELTAMDRIGLRIHMADCCHAASRYEDSRRLLLPLTDDDALGNVDRARVLARLGWADYFLGDVSSCERFCQEAVTLLQPTSHHDELARSQRWLGYALRWSGRLDEAQDHYRDALAAARRGTDRSQVESCLRALGDLHRLQGRYADALRCHRECMVLCEGRGTTRGVAREKSHIAVALFYLGEWSQADTEIAEARRLYRSIGQEQDEALLGILQSRLSRRRGDHARADVIAREALEFSERVGFARGRVLALEELGDTLLESPEPAAARGILEDALAAARAISPDGDLAYELEWRLAKACRGARQLDEAESLARRSLEAAERSQDLRETGNALGALAAVLSDRGEHAQAVAAIERAIEIFRRIATPFELAAVHEEAAAIAARRPSADTAEALGHLFVAGRIYARLGAVPAAERVEAEIHEREQGEAPVAAAASGASRRTPLPAPVAETEEMRRILTLARDLAPYDTTVLLEGETGSGKEVLARLLHESGPRADRPFVPLNCAAFAQQLLDSELFGHRRGAFTGADRDRAGRLEAAADGTVFLDEIDKASLDLQAKLLRVVEDRRIVPVGANDTVPLRARIVVATNRDLRVAVEQGLFLADLYYRLAAFRIRVLPLRERPADIRALARHFLDGCRGRFGRRRYEVSPEAMAGLLAYPWPGNVRELRNVVESAAFRARDAGRIAPEHLPEEIVALVASAAAASLPEQVDELERREIRKALTKAEGNKTLAAQLLGVSRKGLLDRIRRLGME